jgi:CRP-like cAMP-binding protein
MRLRPATALVVPYSEEESLEVARETFSATPMSHFVYLGGFKYACVWQRMLFKIKVRKCLTLVNEDIVLYGTSSGLTDLDSNFKPNVDLLFNKKLQKQEEFRSLVSITFVPSPWYILTPKSTVRRIWYSLMAVLLFYTVSVLPVRVAFYDTEFFDVWAVLDILVDMLFALDIGFNCFCSYYTSSGTHETRLKVIAARYFKSWFIIDLASSLPYTILEYAESGEDISKVRLLKLVRLARLYKVVKYFQIEELEVVEDSCFSRLRERCRSEWRKCQLGLVKILQFMLYVCTAVHLAGCIWYFNARLQNFSPGCWVVRSQQIDSGVETLYLISVYWAFSVVTTVGFGDYSATLKSEITIAMVWMMAGVVFYSFAIGSLSTFLGVINSREDMLSTKLAAIKHFSEETGISKKCTKKITAAVKYHTQHSVSLFKERLTIFKELPQKLKAQVALTMYGSIARTSAFLKGKDLSFVTSVMPCLQPLQLPKGKYLYKEGEHAGELYLIVSGQVDFVLRDYRFVFKSFLKGSYIGDSELVIRSSRTDDVRAAESSEFLTLTKSDLSDILQDFPHIHTHFKSLACEKARRTALMKTKVLACLKAHESGTPMTEIAELFRQFPVPPINLNATPEEHEEKARHSLKEVRSAVEELSVKLRDLEMKVGSIFEWLDSC